MKTADAPEMPPTELPPPSETAPDSVPATTIEPAPLELAELDRLIRSVDPAALLAPGRIVRRVIKEDCRLAGWGFLAPHRKSYVIDRARLLEHVEPDELGLPEGAELPETVLLIAQPTPDALEQAARDDVLTKYWRLLFHCRVHAGLDRRIAAGELSTAAIRRRVDEIGQVEFDEIRQVLSREDFLLPPRDDRRTYVEFAAVYLEFKRFAPGLLPHYFPALRDRERIDSILARDVDDERLFAATRLTAAEPDDAPSVAVANEAADPGTTQVTARPRRFSDKHFHKLIRKAEKAAAQGNLVRAAIFRAHAALYAPPRLADHALAAMHVDMDCLIHRLRAALELAEDSPAAWHQALVALAHCTTRGFWTVEARLLFDLQKVCLDHEREIYTVDVVEWALSMGASPIKRALPSQREVLMTKHLRSAARRLAFTRLSPSDRHSLSALLKSAAARAEERMRDQFRPLIGAAIAEVGLAPANLPERVARKKLVEELLDRIADRGFLTMGDLRDALSRNNLKLPDFSGSRDFRGDPMLRIDGRLASSLDGVYNAGEIYLRWLQQLSSLAFGTRLGRFLTRYVAIPFGGAYTILAGLQHLVHMAAKARAAAAIAEAPAAAQGLQAPGLAAASAGAAGEAGSEAASHVLVSPLWVFSLGLFILCMMRFEPFRRGVMQSLQSCYRALRAACLDFPLWVARLPLVRSIVESKPFRLFVRFVLKPLGFTAVIGAVFPLEHVNWRGSLSGSLAIFLAVNLLLNSRWGRTLEEVVVDWAEQTWRRFGLRLVTGLYWFVVDVSKSVLEAVDRFLYSVDEWLRFRAGQSGAKLALKGVLGIAWFFVTYVVRFCVNLLIEPQINPIKHFPVVTVSHKLLFPLIPYLTTLLAITMEKGLAITVAGLIITSIPGIFGFLVWELKENWRLYAANRRECLGPAVIGSHGESMVRLLKPGFHSGTLPKLYAKLRRAQRRGRASGKWQTATKRAAALHHAELSLRRCAQRELVELLGECSLFAELSFSVGKVQTACNCVRIEIRCGEFSAHSLWLAFEVQSGWMTGGILEQGWASLLSPPQRLALSAALAGFYKTGALDIVRQQIVAAFPPPMPPYDVKDMSLLVWPEAAFDVEIAYDLRRDAMRPQVVDGAPRRSLPTLERSEILFREQPLRWFDWVRFWVRADGAGKMPAEPFPELLPPIEAREGQWVHAARM